MRITVDPIKCEAHGLCAELLPERITLDEWGYPLIDGTPIPVALHDLARRAASACPTLALSLHSALLVEADPPPRRTDPPPRRATGRAGRSGGGGGPRGSRR